MKISCPTCSAKYSIADEKVQNRLAKIRCRKCGTSIVIDGNVSPANVYAADAAPAPAPEPEAAPAPAAEPAAAPAAAPSSTEVIYTVDLGENDQRQMSTPQLVEAYNTGAVTAETYVWADGFADWTPLGQVEELVAALHAAAEPAAAAPPLDEASAVGASTQVEEKPWDSGPNSPDAAAAPAAAGGPDLFGSVTDAGAESEGVSVGTASNPFSGANTGARNESSVLFSLSALTSGTGSSRPSVPAPAPSTSGNVSEDSGLIDLKALTATAEAGGPGAPQQPPPAPVAAVSPFGAPSPLGAPSPIASPSIGPGAMPAQKNNTGLIIGISIVVAAVAVAAIMTFGGNEEQPVAPPVPAVTAPPAAAPAPAPEPAPEPAPAASAAESDAKPPATGTEADPPAPSVQKKTYSKPKTSAPAPKASPSPSPAPKPKPKPKPKPQSKCGCKADDLMCLMNCAK